ncbi:MAG TPA: adenylyltransferase/cytidyltransferase family protein [Spirochaetia bacterium]|nr:adenylyltransferase/cytidyltransferase family protein [Spirochaetia bacterium]
MTKVLVFGAFDVIHPGHIDFLKQAREHGDYLIASIARDSYIKEWKGKVPIHSEEVRRQYLLETGMVDEVILGDEVPGSYILVARIHPDVICLGYDQEAFRVNITEWLAKHLPETKIAVLTPYKPEVYESSKLNAAAYRENVRKSSSD